MLTHLIILLDDTSVSYCCLPPSSGWHGACPYTEEGSRHLMPLDTLRQGIVWAMKENLNIQFVYPDYPLTKEYDDLIETIDHTKIKPETQANGADVVVLTEWKEHLADCIDGTTCIIHASRQELAENIEKVKLLLEKAMRINVVLTDVEVFRDEDADDYARTLDALASHIVEQYARGRTPQLNLLTDRLMIGQMNNCGAGDNNITLAPDGKFYLCPTFYLEDVKQSIGDLSAGLNIKNQQLSRLDHAPICRVCDAFHCRRCMWMNERLTGDLNTPSHQQCVVSHLERNASRRLQQRMAQRGIRLEGSKEITELDYLDPFVIATRWK